MIISYSRLLSIRPSVEETLYSLKGSAKRRKSRSLHVVSFLKLVDGQIAEMDEYWSDDGDVPEWRCKMGIGKRMK